jgi:hypothetical protein
MEAAWAEEYQGGSPEAERLVFDQLAKEIMHVQLKNQRSASATRAPWHRTRRWQPVVTA